MVVSDEALRPFRSRRGRLVATVMAVVSLLVFGAIAVLLPTNAGLTSWEPVVRLLVAGLGVVIAPACWRYATIRAVPSLDGLVIRNLVVTRTVTWAQVVDVEFGGGEPWVTLELDDTYTLAVMAIQRADGEMAMTESKRLAGLVRDLG